MKTIFVAFLISISTISFGQNNIADMVQAFDNFSDAQLKAGAIEIDQIHLDGLKELKGKFSDILPTNFADPSSQDQIVSNINSQVSPFAANRLQCKAGDAAVNNFRDIENFMSTGTTGLTNALQNAGLSNQSAEFYQLLSELQGLINNNQLSSLPALIENEIKDKVPTLSNNFEKFLYMSMAYVAKGSATYWANNLQIWEDELNDLTHSASRTGYHQKNFSNETINLKSEELNTLSMEIAKREALIRYVTSSQQDILWADVTGAGVGAVRGAIRGGITGTVIPGMGTVAGAAAGGLWGMVSGAVVGSVSAGIGGWLKSTFWD